MRILHLIPIVLLISLPPCLAHKVTVDPNTSPQTASKAPTTQSPYDPSKDTDERMAKKVSYEASHARLSAVVAELSEQCGVPMTCGRSKNDWSNRDVPVTVYAKDVPLGLLLRAIARATHSIVRAEKLNGRIVYRICQDAKLARALDGYDSARKAYRKSRLSYDWDLLLALKDIPETHIDRKIRNGGMPSQFELTQKLSCVLAELGPGYKQRLMSGQPLTLLLHSLPVGTGKPLFDAYTALRNRYDMNWSYRVSTTSGASDAPAIDDIDSVTATIYSSEGDDGSGQRWGDLRINIIGPTGGLGMTLKPSEYVKPEGLNTPGLPKPPSPPQITEDSPYDVSFPQLQDQKVTGPDAKIDMDDLAKKEGLNYAAVMKEIAKRAGFSFVVEDWDYSKRYPDFPRAWLSKSVRLCDVLLSPSYITRIDMQDKIIVTLVEDWPYKHLALVPASLIDGLEKKLSSDGVDFDEMLPAMCLTYPQWDEWIEGSKDLDILKQHLNGMSGRDPLWSFFARLSPADRAAAASPDGLSLAGFGQPAMADLLYWYKTYLLAHSSPNPKLPETLDERWLSRLVLYLKSYQSPFHAVPKGKVAPKGIDVTYRYEITLSLTGEGAPQQLCRSYGPSQMPFYSAAREAELLKELTEVPKK